MLTVIIEEMTHGSVKFFFLENTHFFAFVVCIVKFYAEFSS